MKKKTAFELGAGFQELVILHLGLRFGVLQRLAESPANLGELSEASSVPPERLIRLLRALCACTIIASDDGNLFRLTEVGEGYLERQQPILFQGAVAMKAWAFLDRYFETGENPFLTAHGDLVFDFVQKDARVGDILGHAWAERTREMAPEIAKLHFFERVKTVTDIGGADGQMLIGILDAHPHLHGTVFDLAYVQPIFEENRTSRSCADRLSFHQGSFFGPIPPGSDIYMMKWIIHDWDDANAVKILTNCRDAMGPQARLLIIDRVVPESFPESIPYAQADLNMTAVNLGKERTRTELAAVLGQAGLHLVDVHDFTNEPGLKISEARRA